MQKRRRHSDEFKREAVAFANQPGVTATQVDEELGINANLISRGRSELGLLGPKAFTGQGKPRDEELAALKRELSRVKKERGVLREAAFFAKGSTGDPAGLIAAAMIIPFVGCAAISEYRLAAITNGEIVSLARELSQIKSFDRIEQLHTASDGVMDAPRIC